MQTTIVDVLRLGVPRGLVFFINGFRELTSVGAGASAYCGKAIEESKLIALIKRGDREAERRGCPRCPLQIR